VLCPNCKSWEIAAEAADRFCSWCACSAQNTECFAAPEIIYCSPHDEEIPTFNLHLKNHGLVPLEITGIATEPVSCAFFEYFVTAVRKKNASQKQSHLLLAPGEERILAGHFQATALQTLLAPFFDPKKAARNKRPAPPSASSSPALTNKPESGENLSNNNGLMHGLQVRFVVMLPGEEPGPECALTVLPRPEFELLTPTIEIQAEGDADAGAEFCQATGRMRLQQGCAHIHGIASEMPGIKFSFPPEPNEQGAMRLDEANRVFDFRVEVERELLMRHLKSGELLQANMKLICDDPPVHFTPNNAPLRLVPRRMPRLTILEAQRNRTTGQHEMRAWALAGQRREFMLRLKNTGETTLELYAIEATSSLECLKRKPLDLPLRIAPQAAIKLPFIIDTQGYDAEAEVTGALALRYRGATRETFSTECALRFDVRVPKPFAGVAALDFGTAQSCIAIAKLGHEQETRLVKIQNDPFVPTAITYQNLEDGGERTYEIGYAALSSSGKEAALHVVQDFKQHVGEEQARQVYLTGAKQVATLPYHVIITDYLRRLVATGEEHLANELYRQEQSGAEADFSRCQLREMAVICPATFTFQQKQALRHALAELGCASEENAQLLPAPALSACSELETSIARWQEEFRRGTNQANTRHILVYEMGAGATEMALVRVAMNPPAGHTLAEAETLQVNLKILGSEGDEQFGGNNLTAALAKYLAQQALTQLEAKFGTKVVLPLWHRLGQTPNKKMEQVGFVNWKRLWQHAESLKCQFADLSLPARVTLPRLTLQIFFDKTFQVADVEKLVVHSALLEKVVKARMELHVRRVQNLLRQARLAAPDRILLAGKSTLLPGVQKYLAGALAAQGCEVEYLGRQSVLRLGEIKSAPPSLYELKAAAALGGAKYLRLLKSEGSLNVQPGPPMKTVMRIGMGVEENGNTQFLPIIENEVEIGVECAAPPFALTWETAIPIYVTNKSGTPDLSEEAELIGRFALVHFKPALPADLTEEELQHALQLGRLRLKLTRLCELQVLLRVRGREHAIYFELD